MQISALFELLVQPRWLSCPLVFSHDQRLSNPIYGVHDHGGFLQLILPSFFLFLRGGDDDDVTFLLCFEKI